MIRLLVALCLCACGPKLIWSGHTADRRARIDVVADGGYQYVVVDGHRQAAYRAVAGWSVVVKGSHIAFAAQVGSQWAVIVDGHVSDRWDGIGEIVLGPSGRVAFVAERADGWYVVIDGHANERYDSIARGSLQFSANDRHVAYVAERHQRVAAVVDGRAGPWFDGIGSLTLTSTGHFAYAAREGARARVVIDGIPGPSWDAVTHVTLADAHVAYAALDDTLWRVVVDGTAGPAVDKVMRVIVSNSRVAAVARLGQADVLTLDGVPIAGGPRLRADTISFHDDHLAYVVPVATGGERVVVDDAAQEIFDEVTAPVWSSRGELAYLARRANAWFVVRCSEGSRDVVTTALRGRPSALTFSPDATRLGYIEQRDRATFVVVDDTPSRFDFVFDDTLTFSADSRRWGVIAGDLVRERLFFAIEGRPRQSVSVHEVYSAAASGAGPHALRDWTQAEADR